MRKKCRMPVAAFVLCGAFMMALNVQKMPLYADTVQDTVITNDEMVFRTAISTMLY